MSARQDKRLRREVRLYLKNAGATPEAIAAHYQAAARPCPRWLPGWGWKLLVRAVLAPPRPFR